MNSTARTPLALLLAAVMLPGCGVVAGGVAGGVAGSEIEEGDGRFDPLEETEFGEEVYE